MLSDYPSYLTDYVTGIVLNQDEEVAFGISAYICYQLNCVFHHGYLCRYYRHCKRSGQTPSTPAIPVYEDVLPQLNTNQSFELKKNIAYGPISD